MHDVPPGRRGPSPRPALPALLLGLLLLTATATLWASPRIGVLTMGPGAEYWSRFGHNALLVEQPDGRRTVYNYGFFDFEQPGFLLRFARGQMRYRLVALPFEQDFAYYQAEGRGMVLQWLRLTPEQATELADFLAWNAREENAEYSYEYFLDNCSTRVRDALDAVLEGRLKVQTRGRSRGLSYRSEALRLSAPDTWMFAAIHLLLGPDADQPLSRWEEAFVPARLHDALNLVTLEDGTPLVESDTRLLPQQLPDARVEEPRFALPASAVGLLLAAMVLLGARRGGFAGVATRGVLAIFWITTAVLGLISLTLWGATEHHMGFANRTLLLCAPWGLALLPALARLARGQTPTRLQHGLAVASAACATLTLPLYLLPVRPQDHLEWIVLLLPLHLAAWRVLRPLAARASNDRVGAPH